jgi:heterodisulfide reductase subunit A
MYTIDTEHCIGCGLCRAVCEPEAIDISQKDEIVEVDVGTIIIATGYELYDASRVKEYGYGRYENVITSLEFERLINASGPTEGKLIRISDRKEPEKIVFVQCVGSRSERANPYCSGICCMYTLKHAQQIKEKNSEAEVYILYMDLRAVGKGYEEFYWRAKNLGVEFIRGRPSKILEDEKTGNLRIFVENTTAGRNMEIEAELVVLAPAIIPRNIEKIKKMLNLTSSPDGFLMEAHAKLRPVDTLTSGVFLAGCAQSPKDIPSSVAQGSAAASRAATLMGMREIEIEPIIAYVTPELCFGCELCKEICDFNALDITWGKAYVREPVCYGCGACAASCPTGAIQIRNFADKQIYAQIEEAFKEYDEPAILAFLCNWCSYAGADTAGLARMQYPSNIKIIRVMCSARVDPVFILKAFAHGADGVLVAGCHLGDCHYMTGNYKAKRRIEKLQSLLGELGIERERLMLEWISASEGEKFARVVTEFTEKIKRLGPSPLKVRV